MNKLPTIFKLLAILIISLALSGCANKPFLTTDNTFAIVTTSGDGKVETTPITLEWNYNQAVLQKLLGEASFVLSDLHTLTASTQSASTLPKANSGPVTFLKTSFPESKKLLFNIDGLAVNMDVHSIQVEVQGPDIGRVVLNESWALQGISDPNLSPAFSDFLIMLQRQKGLSKNNPSPKQDKISPAEPTGQAGSEQAGSKDQGSPKDQNNPKDQNSPKDQNNSSGQDHSAAHNASAIQNAPTGQTAPTDQMGTASVQAAPEEQPVPIVQIN